MRNVLIPWITDDADGINRAWWHYAKDPTGTRAVEVCWVGNLTSSTRSLKGIFVE